MRDRYIKASELRTFEYCERAWFFEREGAPSTLEPERAEGRGEHAADAGEAIKVRTASYLAAVLFGPGIVGLATDVAFWALYQ
jgi:hypothetical protein